MNKIKEISDYYWNVIEININSYKDTKVKEMLKKKFNFNFDDELIFAIIYENNTNLKEYRNKKIYSMLEDNFTFEEIKKSLQEDYERYIKIPIDIFMGW